MHPQSYRPPAPHRRTFAWQWTSKQILMALAFGAMVCSAIYWWGVQSRLTDDVPIAIAFTLLLVLAPPALTSFLIPWSPAGMLLQQINARTWGYAVVVACALFLVYYSFQLQWSWWMTEPVIANSNLVMHQVLVGIIGFILIPALVWTPVRSEELVEQAKQAHLVKRYELQTQADIAILRATLLRAQEKALVGFAHLTVEEREELAGVMHGLIAGIDRTLGEIGQSVKTISGAAIPFGSLADNEDIRTTLEYIGDTIVDSALAMPVADADGDGPMDGGQPVPPRRQRAPSSQPLAARTTDRHPLGTLTRYFSSEREA